MKLEVSFLRWRSYGYALATVLLALVLGWAGRVTWQELRQLHRSFDSIQQEAFQLSDHITAAMDDLNNLAQRFNLRGRAEDRAAFQTKSERLREWIRAHEPSVTTTQERALVDRIETAVEHYTLLSSGLMEERAPAGPVFSATRAREQLDAQAAAILQLSEELQTAEHGAEGFFMDDSRSALAWLQELLAVQMGLLVILIATAAVAIYRGVIGPLRIELGESRARAARHEKLAALGTLAAGVAHEIRNPLTAINVRVHSLKKNLIPNSSEHEDALVIGHEIQRLESIVQGVLLFARPAEPNFVTISADSLLARMEALFGPQFARTAIHLNLESVPDMWVRVDPHQVEQVLINLVQNAAESMARGGTITLRARPGTARLNAGLLPAVTLEVRDTGTGIPPAVRERIFDPFFTTKDHGTGLGLAIAARIVEKHGGLIECRSEVNRGTTFAILLPQAKPEKSDEFSDQNFIN